MERGYDLSTWKNRRELLIRFQKALLKKFSIEDYNVFIFGSYITAEFVHNESDIDIIIYCKDAGKRNDIELFANEFFLYYDLQSDILQYFFSENAPIYAVILDSLRLTDYFPKELKNELYYLLKIYDHDMRQKREKQRYLHWCYLMKKDELVKGGISTW